MNLLKKYKERLEAVAVLAALPGVLTTIYVLDLCAHC